MILELKDIQLSFSNARNEVFNLLAGIDLPVEAGKVTALIGGNGAGKTTLFNIISGFEKEYHGKVLFNGHDISKKPPHHISRMGIGRLFQGRQLMNDLTLMENLKIASDDTASEKPFASVFQTKRIKETEASKEQKAIELLCKVFGNSNKYLQMLDCKASELSYGEQRLIALVSLLMGHNRLLLLDEPTSGINPKYIESFRSVIRNMVTQDGLSILLIEHNMSFVRSVTDSCHYLADGKIIKSGSVADILDDSVIRKYYLGL